MRHTAHSGKIFLQVLLVLTIAIVAMCTALFAARLGPRKVERSRADQLQEQRELKDWSTRSRELWERFEALYGFHEKDWRKLTQEERGILREALELREKYVMQALGDPEMIIDAIRARWAEIHAEECRFKSIEVEKEAIIARDAKKWAEAVKLYSQAIALEEEIQEKYAASRIRDQSYSRLIRMREEVRRATGQPVWEESTRAEADAKRLSAEGEELLKKGDFEGAAKKWKLSAEEFAKAVETDRELTAKFGGIFPSQHLRATELRVALDTMNTREEHERLQRLTEDADRFAAEGKNAEAENTWREITKRYDSMRGRNFRSEYVRESEDLKRTNRRDLLLSKPYYDSILQRTAALDEALRSNNAEGVPNAALLLLGEEANVQRRYPAAPPLALEIAEKLRYLSSRGDDIPLIQNRIQQMLRPVPSHPDVQMLATEMPQSIYTLLLGNNALNPSAVRGDTLPVDSAAYTEATECCRRLGWILGLKVRLPSESEFRAAAGNPSRSSLSERAWSFENSNSTPHPVGSKAPNENGFYDILGNVSEWTLAPDYTAEAQEFGGNYGDNFDTLAQIPTHARSKRDKSRQRGFRVVVEKTPATTKK